MGYVGEGGRRLRRLALAAGAGLLMDQGNHPGTTLDHRDNQIETIKAVEDVDVGLYVPLFNPKDGGIAWYSFAHLIDPAYVAVTRTFEPANAKFIIPYRLASALHWRHANYGPENEETVQEFIQQQIKNDIGQHVRRVIHSAPIESPYEGVSGHRLESRSTLDKLAGLPWDVEDYSNKQGSQKVEILEVASIHLRSHTSPEADYPQSVLSENNADQKNIDVGNTRAQEVGHRVHRVLTEMGLDDSAITYAAEVHEVQFNAEEWQDLLSMAEQVGKVGQPEDQIFSLVDDYNSKRITDTTLRGRLSEILETKRSVEVEIQFKNGTKETTLIPLPLLIVLGVGYVLTGKKSRQEKA